MKTLKISAELMDEYRKMTTVAPEKRTRVCAGEKSMYSVGTDGHLYCLRENIKEHKGWEQTDLTGQIPDLSGHASVEVTAFDARANEKETRIVFSAKCDGKNRIFYGKSVGGDGYSWQPVLQAEQNNEEYEPAALYLPESSEESLIICDFLRDGRIVRRAVRGEGKEQGNKYPELPVDFSETVQSLPGSASGSKVDGIYTFGVLSGEKQLLFVPHYNRFNRELPPLPMRLAVDQDVDAIAVLDNGSGTDLFACGGGHLFCYPGGAGKDLCAPVILAESEYFTGVTSFCIYRTDSELAAAGINRKGEMFISRASLQNWSNPEAWGQPYAVSGRMLAAECIWDQETGKECAFGVSGDGKYVRWMERSKETGFWTQESIMIPAPDQTAVKIPSYVTRIQVTEDGTPGSEEALTVRASQPCRAYVNGQYYILDDRGQTVECDKTGCVRIVEQANGLHGTELIVEMDDVRQKIAPSRNAVERLFELDSPEKLRAASVNGRPLVDSSSTDEQLAAVAKTMDVIGKSKAVSALWEDDNMSFRRTAAVRRNLEQVVPEKPAPGKSVENPQQIRLSFEAGNLCGIADGAIGKYQLMSVAGCGVCAIDTAAAYENGLDVIYTTAAEFFRKLKEAGEKIIETVISCADDIWRFTLQIGKKIYTFVMDTLEKLEAGLLKLFEYIKAGAEKIIEYVKYVFDWDDIKRTAKALECAALNSFDILLQQTGALQGDLHSFAEKITSALDKWADIEHCDVTHQSLQDRAGSDVSLDVRQSYLLDYSRQNLSNSSVVDSNLSSLPEQDIGIIEANLKNIFGFLDTEGIILDDFVKKIRDELLDAEKLKTMSFGEIARKLLAVITDTAVYTLENIIFSALEIVKILVSWIKKMLSTPIHIPIVSDILKDVFGIEEKSILEIGCLVIAAAAVPLLKLCGQGRLFREEVFACIENAGKTLPVKNTNAGRQTAVQTREILSEAANNGNAAELLISEAQRDAYGALHIICGVVNLCETGAYLMAEMEEEQQGAGISFWSVAEIALSALDGGCYIAAVFVFQPCQLPLTNWIRIFNTAASTIKYSGLVVKSADKAFGLCLPADSAALKFFDKIKSLGEYLNAIGAGLSVIGNIFYMAMGTDGKNQPEKTLLYLDGSSLIGDNIRVILDNFIPHQEDKKVKAILKAVRSFFSVTYSALQIAEGSTGISYPVST